MLYLSEVIKSWIESFFLQDEHKSFDEYSINDYFIMLSENSNDTSPSNNTTNTVPAEGETLVDETKENNVEAQPEEQSQDASTQEIVDDEEPEIESIDDLPLEATAAGGELGEGFGSPFELGFGSSSAVESIKRKIDKDKDGLQELSFDEYVPFFDSQFLIQSFPPPLEPDLCDFHVTYTFDVLDADDGELSLREAIVEANSNENETDIICLGEGEFVLSIDGGAGDDISFLNGDNSDYGAFVDESGDLDIIQNLIIEGMGRDLTFINADEIDRVLEVREGVTLTLRNLTITGGDTSREGGGILNRGNLILENVCITENNANREGGGIAAVNDAEVLIFDSIITDNTTTRRGGGIFARGEVDIDIENSVVTDNVAKLEGGGIGILLNTGETTIENSLISDNQGSRGAGVWLNRSDATIETSTISDNGELGGVRTLQGGGIYSHRGEVNLIESTVSDNNAERGGGLYLRQSNNVGKEINIENSTISGNETSKNDGGALYVNRTTVNIDNSTITENTSKTGGAVDLQTASKVNIESSIVAQNVDDKDLTGNGFTSLGNNLIGNSDSSNFSGLGSDIEGSKSGIGVEDAGLLPLNDNGGPTETHALDVGSQAIDSGSNSNSLTIDQRGAPREVGLSVDIGAFESGGVAPISIIKTTEDHGLPEI
jgi:hypothetical protein